MLRLAAAYGATAVVFLALDFIWLSSVALGMYRRELGGLLLDKPSLGIASAFYLIYVAGVVFFCVNPALHGGSWLTALGAGAVLGLVAYGTYDITNLSTLKGWSVQLSLIDLAWGTTLTAVSAAAGTAIASLVPA
jgi:uncharacterized membrane protein